MGTASLPPPGLGTRRRWAVAAGGPPGQVKKSGPLRAWRTLGGCSQGQVPPPSMSDNRTTSERKKEQMGSCALNVNPP